MSTYESGTRLGLSPSTAQRILKDEGIQLRSPFDRHLVLPLTVDDQEYVIAEPQSIERQVVEAKSIPYALPLDQLAATMGWIEEAPVVYESADNVPHAGVFLGLALFEDTQKVDIPFPRS